MRAAAWSHRHETKTRQKRFDRGKLFVLHIKCKTGVSTYMHEDLQLNLHIRTESSILFMNAKYSIVGSDSQAFQVVTCGRLHCGTIDVGGLGYLAQEG